MHRGILAAGWIAATLSAQGWHEFEPRLASQVVHEAWRGRTMVYGLHQAPQEFQGWQWDATGWVRVPQAGTLPPWGAYVHEAARGQTLALQWLAVGAPIETYATDGATWRRVPTQHAPPTRVAFARAHDWVRGRTVMFGGYTPSFPELPPNDETWIFDGVDWVRHLTAHTPPPRSWANMVFDSVRGVCVLFGGGTSDAFYQLDPANLLADTWEYDGVDWRQVATAHAPPPCLPMMAFDVARARTWMLPSGRQDAPPTRTIWAFDGTDWTEQQTGSGPETRMFAGMDYDLARGVTVLYGGMFWGSNSQQRFDVWEFDGIRWTLRHPAMPTADVTGNRTPVVGDPGADRTLRFGLDEDGLSGMLWTWRDGRWSREPVGNSPQEPGDLAFAFDDRRRCLWCVAGGDWRTPMATLRLDGQAWVAATPTVTPPQRTHSVVAFDSKRARIVLFGGYYATYQQDTWEFDGQQWHAVLTAHAPAGRTAAAMVYDRARDCCVLFGGVAGAGSFDDTWEYDGADWIQRLVPGPEARHEAAMAYDRHRGVVAMTGGWRFGMTTGIDDFWEYDGAWHQRTLGVPRGHSIWRALVYQPASRQQMLVDLAYSETLLIDPPRGASFARCGPGCAGSNGVPELAARGNAVPHLGSTMPLQLRALPTQPGLAVLLLGTSILSAGGQPLPIELDGLGLPGCLLWTSIDLTMGFAFAGPEHEVALGIPRDGALAGAAFGAQVLVPDAAAPNGLGAVSNGAVLVLD